MKRLYLLRHAKSSHDDPALKDLNRPLNKRGVMASHLMGQYLRENGLIPDYILCSPAMRTRTTLKNALAQLDQKNPDQKNPGQKIPCVFEDSLYLAQPNRVLDLIRRTNDAYSALMIVGHNPTINILAHDLNDGKNREDHRRLIEKYPTGALAVLDFPLDHWQQLDRRQARLERFVCPKDLI